MFRFKLIGGSYVEDEKSYSRGAEVLSRHNLVKLFPNKFVLLETLPDLVEEEVDEFDRPPIPTPKKNKVQGAAVPEAPLDPSSAEEEPSTGYGQDVSADYPKALSNGLNVFRNTADKGYYIVNPETNEVLNVKAIRKSEIQPFLDEYLE